MFFWKYCLYPRPNLRRIRIFLAEVLCMDIIVEPGNALGELADVLDEFDAPLDELDNTFDELKLDNLKNLHKK